MFSRRSRRSRCQCSLGTIAANASATVTIVATPTTAVLRGPGLNLISVGIFGSVAADELDPVAGNNSIRNSAFNVRRIQADLGVAVTASPAPVIVGEPATLTAVVTNNGPDPATNVQFSGLDFVASVSSAISASTTQGVCQVPGQAGYSGTSISCSLGTLGTQASDRTATITVVATLTAAAAPFPTGNSVNMNSDVTASELDPMTANNQFRGSFGANQRQADVGVTVTANPDPVREGEPVTLTAVVTNGGPDGATAVTLLLPMTVLTRDFSNHMVTPSQGTCAPVIPGDPIQCSLGSISASGSATVTIVATPGPAVFGNVHAATASVGIYADVSAVEPDPVSSNNQFSSSFGVTRPPQRVTVTKSGPGAGTVTSTPAGIDCGATCSAVFDFGTTVTLSAAPAAGSMFAGWSGAFCSGTSATCTVSAEGDVSVGAVFAVTPDFAVTIVPAAPGPFTVGQSISMDLEIRSVGGPAGSVPVAYLTLPPGVTEPSGGCNTPGRTSPCTMYIPLPGSYPWRQAYVLMVDTVAVPASQLSAAGSIIFGTEPVPGEVNLLNNQATFDVTILPQTPIGTNVTVQPLDLSGVAQPITMTFSDVTAAGLTTAVPIANPPELPANFAINGSMYEITTTAQFTPPVTVCFTGSFGLSDWVMHFEGGVWVKLPNQQRLPAGDPPYTSLCAETQTLSPFVVGTELNNPPTADAGTDQTVETTSPSGAAVTLTGSGSDPDGDPLTFTWSGPCGTASGSTATLTCPIGASTMTLTVSDGVNPPVTDTVTITVTFTSGDTTPPRVTCGAADTIWHATDLVVACTASDDGSGLASAADASFTLTTGVVVGAETATAFTDSRTVCDAAGNCAPAGPIGPFKIDRKAPAISITRPLDGAAIVLNERTAAGFACADAGSGVAACSGTVANGARINTSSVGTKSFTVTATDAAGNRASTTISYPVTFAASGTCFWEAGHEILWPIAPNGSSQFRQGTPVPARFRVCDANGHPVGSPGVVSTFKEIQKIKNGIVQEVNLDVPAVVPPPVFRWSQILRAWIFVIDTRRLADDTTHVFRITLADGTAINFRFSLRE